MSNLVLNDQMLESTVSYSDYDQYLNVVTITGDEDSPDRYHYLGGSDYGTFLEAGAVWDNDGYGSGKAIYFDMTNPLIRTSLGVTQVVAINQTERNPIKISCFCKTTGVNGTPKVLFDVIGFNGESSGSSLTFDSGTTSYTKKTKINVFSFKVKYAFLHFYTSGFDEGEVWYSNPYAEEIEIEQVEYDPDNNLMNYNFIYTSDESDTIGWTENNMQRYSDVITPLGITSLKFKDLTSYISQIITLSEKVNSLCRLKMYLNTVTGGSVDITLRMMDRHRRIVNEKTTSFSISPLWGSYTIECYKNDSIEKIQILIQNTSGTSYIAGGYFNFVDVDDINLLVDNNIDSSFVVDSSMNDTVYKQVSESSDFDLIKYIDEDIVNYDKILTTNGVINELSPYKLISDINIVGIYNMDKIASYTDYDEYSVSGATPTSTDQIHSIFVNDKLINEYLGIPHLNHSDDWISRTGGYLLDQTTYYCVTAVLLGNETNYSNHTRVEITTSESNSNVITLEITPPINIELEDPNLSFKIYRTRSIESIEDTDWRITAVSQQLPIWNDKLLDEITIEELRNNGYLYVDDGWYGVGSGTPPETNECKIYEINESGDDIILKLNYKNSNTVSCLMEEYEINDITNICGYNYGLFFIVVDNKIYTNTYDDLDIFKNVKTSLSEIKDIKVFNNELYYLNDNMNFPDDSIFTFSATPLMFDVDSTNVYYICQKNSSQKNIYIINQDTKDYVSTTYSINDDINFFGKYYNGFIIVTDSKIIQYSFNTTSVIKEIDINLNMLACNIKGNIFSACIEDIGIIQYDLNCEKYYGEINYFQNINYDSYNKPIGKNVNLNEYEDPEYPELISNSIFYNNSIPVRFKIYCDADNVTYGMSEVHYFDDSYSVYFNFSTSAWGSINRDDLNVVSDVYYVVSFMTKATKTTTGLLGYTFKNANDIGDEKFVSFTNTLDWTEQQFVIKATLDTVKLDFRILNYGSSEEYVLYYINSISVKEDTSLNISGFEHLFNNNFTIYPSSMTTPIGYYTGGVQAGTAEQEIIIDGDDIQWKITADEYDEEEDNWLSFHCQTFPVTIGDVLKLQFKFKTNNTTNEEILIGLDLSDSDGNRIDVDYQWADTIGGSVENSIEVRFDSIPDNAVEANFFIWCNFYGKSGYFWDMSILPVGLDEIIENSDFDDGLDHWSVYNSNPYADTYDGRTVGVVPVDMSLNPTITYTEISQTIYFNQPTPIDIEVESVANHRLILIEWVAWWGGSSRMEMQLEYMDDEVIWNEEIPVSGTYDPNYYNYVGWVTKSFTITPTKPVKSIRFIFATGWGGIGYLYVDRLTVSEPYPEADAIEVSVPSTSIFTYNPTGNFSKSIIFTVRLQYYVGEVLEYLEVENGEFTIDTDIPYTSMEILKTNSKGIGKILLNIPECIGVFYCIINFTTYIEEKEVNYTEYLTVIPKELEISRSITNEMESTDELFFEVFVSKPKKSLINVNDRVGTWEIFRPTVFNADQMLDYEMHISPESSWEDFSPEVLSKIYTKQLYFQYFDYLSDYPTDSDYIYIENNRNEWFCVDTSGRTNPFGDGRAYYDWKDMELTKWFTERYILNADSRNYYDGIYLDDFWTAGEGYSTVGEFEWESTPSSLLNYKSTKEVVDSQNYTLSIMKNTLNKKGKYFMCNFGTSTKFDFTDEENIIFKSYDSILLTHFDGILREVWLYGWDEIPTENDDEDFDLEHVRSEIHLLKWCEDNNKFIVCLSRQDVKSFETRMFCFAAFCLGKGSYSYYSYSQWGAWFDRYGSYWHDLVLPENKSKLGDPIDESYVFLSDVVGHFYRRFDNGIALLNMEEVGETDMTYTLDDIYYDLRGNSYTTNITIGFKEGLVIYKENGLP